MDFDPREVDDIEEFSGETPEDVPGDLQKDQELARYVQEFAEGMAEDVEAKQELSSALEAFAADYRSKAQDLDQSQKQLAEYRQTAMDIAERGAKFLEGNAEAIRDMATELNELGYDVDVTLYDTGPVEDAMSTLDRTVSAAVDQMQSLGLDYEEEEE